MRHPSTLVCVVMLALIACSGLAEANAASRAPIPELRRANRLLLAVLRISPSQLHVRDK